MSRSSQARTTRSQVASNPSITLFSRLPSPRKPLRDSTSRLNAPRPVQQFTFTKPPFMPHKATNDNEEDEILLSPKKKRVSSPSFDESGEVKRVKRGPDFSSIIISPSKRPRDADENMIHIDDASTSKPPVSSGARSAAVPQTPSKTVPHLDLTHPAFSPFKTPANARKDVLLRGSVLTASSRPPVTPSKPLFKPFQPLSQKGDVSVLLKAPTPAQEAQEPPPPAAEAKPVSEPPTTSGVDPSVEGSTNDETQPPSVPTEAAPSSSTGPSSSKTTSIFPSAPLSRLRGKPAPSRLPRPSTMSFIPVLSPIRPGPAPAARSSILQRAGTMSTLRSVSSSSFASPVKGGSSVSRSGSVFTRRTTLNPHPETQSQLSNLSTALESLSLPLPDREQPPRPSTSMGFRNAAERNISAATAGSRARVANPNLPVRRPTGLVQRPGTSLGHNRPSIQNSSQPTETQKGAAHSLVRRASIGGLSFSLSSAPIPNPAALPKGTGNTSAIETQQTSRSDSGVLADCVIFVDVRTEEGEDAGTLFIDMLRSLGAKILASPGRTATHIVYKSGLVSTYTRYKLLPDPKPMVVGIGWVVECVEKKEKVDEERFKINMDELALKTNPTKRRRSLQVKQTGKVNTSREDEGEEDLASSTDSRLGGSASTEGRSPGLTDSCSAGTRSRRLLRKRTEEISRRGAGSGS